MEGAHGKQGEKSETADPEAGGSIRGIIGLLETAGKTHKERGDLIAEENPEKQPQNPQHDDILHPLISQVPTAVGYQTLPRDVNCVLLALRQMGV